LERLVAAAGQIGVHLDASQQSLFKHYYELLEKGGETANLTGARGWERVREELFIRSLRMLAPAPGGFASTAEWFAPVPGGAARKVLDVGTGAGIPGLVIKIAAPGADVTLLDSSVRKCAFLRRAITELGISGASVVQARAEEAGHDPAHREAYDLVVSRGVAELAELAELTLPFARVGGVVITAKGLNVDDEVALAEYSAELMGAAPATRQVIHGPGSAPADTLMYWFKLSRTPEKFPRRPGMPHKRPLRRVAAAAMIAGRP
jgi:16S rRNA (guanine527-N7)-methyltransferase